MSTDPVARKQAKRFDGRERLTACIVLLIIIGAFILLDFVIRE